MSFDEIVMIVKTCVIGLVTMVAARVLWIERAKIGAVLAAVRDRFFTISFDEFVNRLADTYVEPKEEAPVSFTGTPYRPAPDIDQQIPASMGAARTGTVPTDEALIRHLAGLQKPSGAWCLSANKVFDAVGGDRGSVLAIVREVRGLPDPTPPADPRFPESTKDGRPVASHLQRKQA